MENSLKELKAEAQMKTTLAKATLAAAVLMLATAGLFASHDPPAGCGERKCKQAPVSNTLDSTLKKLRNRAAGITSYQAKLDYLFIQDPELLDARTTRTAVLYYTRNKQGSKLRINFDTISQDDEKPREYLEQILFDGVWLTKIDYQLKTIDSYQQTPQDAPIDAFEFISRNFPIIGFAPTQDIRKHFFISQPDPTPADANDLIYLELKVKPDSSYKDDYTRIDFWINKTTFLPARVRAFSTEEDVYDIQLLDTKVNKNLKNTVFKLETPKDFSQNKHPLEQ